MLPATFMSRFSSARSPIDFSDHPAETESSRCGEQQNSANKIESRILDFGFFLTAHTDDSCFELDLKSFQEGKGRHLVFVDSG